MALKITEKANRLTVSRPINGIFTVTKHNVNFDKVQKTESTNTTVYDAFTDEDKDTVYYKQAVEYLWDLFKK